MKLTKEKQRNPVMKHSANKSDGSTKPKIYIALNWSKTNIKYEYKDMEAKQKRERVSKNKQKNFPPYWPNFSFCGPQNHIDFLLLAEHYHCKPNQDPKLFTHKSIFCVLVLVTSAGMMCNTQLYVM